MSDLSKQLGVLVGVNETLQKRIKELEAEKLDWELHLKDMKGLTDAFFKDITPYMEPYE